MDDSMQRLGDAEPDPNEMDHLGDSFMQYLKDREPFPGTYLPRTIVERQMALSKRSEADLTRLLAEIAVNLAVRDGMKSPNQILEVAVAKLRFNDWQRVKREIRKVLGMVVS